MRKRLTDFHDLDVLVVHLPQLTFSQRHDRGFLGLRHMFKCVLQSPQKEKNPGNLTSGTGEPSFLSLWSLKHSIDGKGMKIFNQRVQYNKHLQWWLTSLVV
jgi:hypothetical protein